MPPPETLIKLTPSTRPRQGPLLATEQQPTDGHQPAGHKVMNIDAAGRSHDDAEANMQGNANMRGACRAEVSTSATDGTPNESSAQSAAPVTSKAGTEGEQVNQDIGKSELPVDEMDKQTKGPVGLSKLGEFDEEVLAKLMESIQLELQMRNVIKD